MASAVASATAVVVDAEVMFRNRRESDMVILLVVNRRVAAGGHLASGDPEPSVSAAQKASQHPVAGTTGIAVGSASDFRHITRRAGAQLHGV